jgi:hypothetical protein
MGKYARNTVIQVAPKGGGRFVEYTVDRDDGKTV